jgi:hypothetical protein
MEIRSHERGEGGEGGEGGRTVSLLSCHSPPLPSASLSKMWSPPTTITTTTFVEIFEFFIDLQGELHDLCPLIRSEVLLYLSTAEASERQTHEVVERDKYSHGDRNAVGRRGEAEVMHVQTQARKRQGGVTQTCGATQCTFFFSVFSRYSVICSM